MTGKQTGVGIIALVIIGGAAFYSGMQYEKSQAPAQSSPGQFAGRSGARAFARGATGGAFTAGQIISLGQGNLTVQLADGNTKLVLIATSTRITKEASGSQGDLTKGVGIMVSGTPNADGSETASSIQIRPAGTPPAQ